MIIGQCKVCGSHDLIWYTTNINQTGIMEGRLRTHEITPIFFLGCNVCSETLKSVTADQVTEQLNRAVETGHPWL